MQEAYCHALLPYTRQVKTSALLPILVLSAMTLPAGSVLYAQATALPRPHKTARATGASPVLPKNIPPARGVMHTAYALKYIDVKLGTGELAAPNKFYTVQYTGWVASNGTKFDSSYDHGSAFTFPAGAHRVIPGWDTGFTGMHIGGKRRLFIQRPERSDSRCCSFLPCGRTTDADQA